MPADPEDRRLDAAMRSKRRQAASRTLYEAAQEYCRQFEALSPDDEAVHFLWLLSVTHRLQDTSERAMDRMPEYWVDQSRRTGGYNPGSPKRPGYVLADMIGGTSRI